MNPRNILKSLMAASLITGLIFFAVSRPKAAAQEKAAAPTKTAAGNNALVARGKYLVEDVAFCINCHTPRDENGHIERSRLLQGTPLFFRPAHPVPDWPIIAPGLAPTPPGTDEEMITLLTTGVWKTGQPLRDPMPKFHMTREDAQAVVAFLKSFRPQ